MKTLAELALDYQNSVYNTFNNALRPLLGEAGAFRFVECPYCHDPETGCVECYFTGKVKELWNDNLKIWQEV